MMHFQFAAYWQFSWLTQTFLSCDSILDFIAFLFRIAFWRILFEQLCFHYCGCGILAEILWDKSKTENSCTFCGWATVGEFWHGERWTPESWELRESQCSGRESAVYDSVENEMAFGRHYIGEAVLVVPW